MVIHGSQGGLRDQMCERVRSSAEQLVKGDGSGLRELLPPAQVQRAVEAEGVKFIDCLFTPLVTLWAFLGQVLGPDRSCTAAVAGLLALLGARAAAEAAAGEKTCDPDPDPGPDPGSDSGAYCKARKRLPQGLVSRLSREAGRELHRKYPAGLLLGGRAVKLVDG